MIGGIVDFSLFIEFYYMSKNSANLLIYFMQFHVKTLS
jgi:hypothetical protein